MLTRTERKRADKDRFWNVIMQMIHHYNILRDTWQRTRNHKDKRNESGSEMVVVQ